MDNLFNFNYLNTTCRDILPNSLLGAVSTRSSKKSEVLAENEKREFKLIRLSKVHIFIDQKKEIFVHQETSDQLLCYCLIALSLILNKYTNESRIFYIFFMLVEYF